MLSNVLVCGRLKCSFNGLFYVTVSVVILRYCSLFCWYCCLWLLLSFDFQGIFDRPSHLPTKWYRKRSFFVSWPDTFMVFKALLPHSSFHFSTLHQPFDHISTTFQTCLVFFLPVILNAYAVDVKRWDNLEKGFSNWVAGYINNVREMLWLTIIWWHITQWV